MDIFRCNVLQENRINLRSAVNVELHPRLGYDMLDISGDILDPAPVLDAQRLHGRRNGQADRIFRPGRICHNQIGGHGIQATGNAFYCGIKALLKKPNSAFSE